LHVPLNPPKTVLMCSRR